MWVYTIGVGSRGIVFMLSETEKGLAGNGIASILTYVTLLIQMGGHQHVNL